MAQHRLMWKLLRPVVVCLTLVWMNLFTPVYGGYYFTDEQYFVREGHSVTITMRRTSAASSCTNAGITSGSLSLNQGSSGADLTITDNTFDFQADAMNLLEAQGTITANADDRAYEGVECFAFQLNMGNTCIDDVDLPSTMEVCVIDQTPWTYFEEAQYIVREGESLTIRIRRGGFQQDSDGTVDVDVTSSSVGETATAGSDYTAVSTPASFSKGASYAEVTIGALVDTNREDIETYLLTLSGSGADDEIDRPNEARVFIIDQSAYYYIEQPQYIIGERAGSLTVRIKRGGYVTGTAAGTVDLTVADGSATKNVDFTSPATTLSTFSTGEDTEAKVFTIMKDALREGVETFTITLTGQSMPGHLYEPSTATVFIIDETAWFSFEAARYFVGEREGSLTVRVRRNGFLWDTNDVTVNVAVDATASNTATGSNTDYNGPTPTTLTFTGGNGESFKDVQFTIVADTNIEDTESVTIKLENQSDGACGCVFLDQLKSTTIFIEDQTTIFWIEEAQYTAAEGDNLVVAVHRNGYISDVDIVALSQTAVSATVNTDYALPGDTLINFAPGETSKVSMAITIQPDTVVEDIEEFTISITLNAATTATRGAVISPNPATVFIFDRTSYFWIEEKQYIVDEGKTLDVIFHRGGYLRRADALTLSATNGRAVTTNDYSLPGDLTINFASGDTTASKTLTIAHDNNIEHWEDFSISIALGASSTTTGLLGSPSTSAVLIRDPTWYNLGSAEYKVWEHDTVVKVAIRREGDISSPGSIAISTQDGTTTAGRDYTAISTAMVVNFVAGVSEVNVSITILPDYLVEKEEVLFIVLSNPSTGEALGTLHKGMVTIFDDDAFFSLEKSTYHLAQKEATTSLVVNVLRVGHIDVAGTVEISTSDITASSSFDYTALQNTVVQFASGEDSQQVTIQLLDDVLVEDDEWFELRLGNPTQGQLGVTRCANVYIADDDSPRTFVGRFTFVEYQGIPVQFESGLHDPTTAIYAQRRTIVEGALVQIFGGNPGFVSARVTSFYRGSIGVAFVVTFDQTVSSNSQGIAQIFNSQLDSQNYLGSSTIKVTPNTVYFGDDRCPEAYCINGGICLANQFYGFSCICPTGFSGPTCEVTQIDYTPRRDDFSPAVIASIVVAVMVVILIIILVCLCYRYLNSPRFKAQEIAYNQRGVNVLPTIQLNGFQDYYQ